MLVSSRKFQATRVDEGRASDTRLCFKGVVVDDVADADAEEEAAKKGALNENIAVGGTWAVLVDVASSVLGDIIFSVYALRSDKTTRAAQVTPPGY